MYKSTIGLEIHIELDTETKMFCECPNNPNEQRPNVHVCPICLGHPGTLPTINRRAVEKVIQLGMALEGTIAKQTHFDRKSYFYPDLPKGYQISQYEHPLVSGGTLEDIDITRVHLEEDTGRLAHDPDGKYSLVDFNRSGVPLAELVTEPNVRDADHAVVFARELQRIVRYAGVSQADMEKGQMRIEANVSVSADERLGTKVEVKNINSFRSVHDAIEYEIKRQEKLLRSGGQVVQETRGWIDGKRITKSQRIKESAHDYRYFPEPDLPPLDLTQLDLNQLKLALPELPAEKRVRLKREYALDTQAVALLVDDRLASEYFEEAASELASLMKKPNYTKLHIGLVGDFRGAMREHSIAFSDVPVTPEHFAHFIALIENGTLSSALAKRVLTEMFKSGEDPETIMREHTLTIIDDASALQKLAEAVVDEYEKAVADYRGGKDEVLAFLVGQIMARTKGQADPKRAREALLIVLKQ